MSDPFPIWHPERGFGTCRPVDNSEDLECKFEGNHWEAVDVDEVKRLTTHALKPGEGAAPEKKKRK